ncbi:MAG TPA: S41 family peptidase [Bryobacteraceae bacterium]|nr:S41 family peptidase [Bryobacteraceae bacterium]
MFWLIPALLLLPPPPAASEDVMEQMKKFIDVYAVVEREAADPVAPEKALYQGAIPGMLRRLDPHSVFLDPDQFQQLKEMETSTRKGFGSIVSVLPGRVIVLQVLPGTPAQKAGLGPGDEILAVNNYPLERLEIEQIIGVLGEARQKQARLAVHKPGNVRILEFTLTPAELQSPSVERSFLLKPGIGYVRVTSFDADTGAQIKTAIDGLGGNALHGLVLDLRNNPGGVLPAALVTASLFLKPEASLLSVRGRSFEASRESVPKDSLPYTFPVAVLVNEKSASASEIVAGALQDHDRAVIVGETTFGKGLVQNVYPLSAGTGLALTTAYYYTPSGRSIQKPLEESQVVSVSPETKKDFRTDSGRLVRGGGGIRPDFEAAPEPLTRFRIVLEASGVFTQFATGYVQRHPGITADFEVTAAALDEFQLYLSARNIRPAVTEWSSEREWISSRLKSEIFNQSLGVERGDEVEAQRDPVILTGLARLGVALKPASPAASTTAP